MTIRKFKIMA